MKTWRRLPFTLLALWAMLLTLVPQAVWSCPMTGRVDVASRVCLGAMSMAKSMAKSTANGEMPCAESGSKCCKPLSVAPSQTGDGGNSHVFTATHPSAVAPQLALPALEAPLFVAPSVETFQAAAVRGYLARFTNSPPPFWTQFRPISLAGRAPPVL